MARVIAEREDVIPMLAEVFRNDSSHSSSLKTEVAQPRMIDFGF